MKIIKRDGRVQEYKREKVINAILGAMKEIDKQNLDIAYAISITIEDLYKTRDEAMDIEKIQDVVENLLMEYGEYDVAKAYIKYREDRRQKRESKSGLNMKISELVNMEGDYLKANANKDAKVFNTKRDLLAGIICKEYALNNILPKDVAEAHKNNEIYWHDLDYSPFFPMFNCMLIDFKGMLEQGFTIGNANVETPKSIETATALVAQIVANVSSNIYGGTSFNRADEVLEPYAIKTYNKHFINSERYIKDIKLREEYAKDMTKKSIYNAMQSLEYELNTIYNSNGQTPFFTIGFGLGKSWLCREIQKAILKVREQGLGVDKKTAVFPKLIFVQKDGLNLKIGDPNFDIRQMALKCTVKRMYPDIINYEKLIEITGSFKFPMGCRSFLGKYIDENGNEIHDGRNNLGVVTINLPRIALESKGDKAEFWNILNKRLDISKKALMYRISTLERAKVENAPILYQYGATGKRLKKTDNVMDIFKNGRASVSLGYIGLYEVGAMFYGGEWEENREAKEFTLEVLKTLYDSTEKWKKETGYAFSIYATPAESLTHTFCKKDREDFGSIENITDKEYYTNSFHYDVRKNPNPFKKIDFESEYLKYTPGGNIVYCEFPSMLNNIEALDKVWTYSYDKVMYFGTNTPIDKCYGCGFEGEFEATDNGFKCPQCGNASPETTSCCRRQCGYLGNPLQRPSVHGRLKEQQARKKHM